MTQHTKSTLDCLAEMFPADPLVADLAAACEREPMAYGVYMKCRWWRLLWEHQGGKKRYLRAYLNNPVWPAKALGLCAKHHVPVPTWAIEWANDLANGRAKAPTEKNRDTARSVEKAIEEISAAMYTTPPPPLRELDGAAKLNPADAARLRAALLDVNDSIGFPRADTRKTTKKSGK